MGVTLGLKQLHVKKMKDSETFKDDVIAAWFEQKEDQMTKKGKPTWETLVEALKHTLVIPYNCMHTHYTLAKLYTQELIVSILVDDCCSSCCWCSFSLRFCEARFCSMLWAYVAIVLCRTTFFAEQDETNVAFGSGAGSSSDAVESGPLPLLTIRLH